MQQNRRSFLKTGSLVAALGLAGCSGGLLDGGDGSQSGGDWKYDPATLAEVGNKFYGDMAFSQIYENREYLPESSQSSFEMGSNSPIEASEIDTVSGVGGASLSPQTGGGGGFGSAVIAGSWSKSALTDQIESEGEATEAGSYEGFTLYEDSGTTEDVSGNLGGQESAMVGIGDGAMVIGAAAAQQSDLGVTGEDAVTTMIDASNGNAPLLTENSDYVGTLNSEISADSMVVGGEVDPSLVELALQQAGTTERGYVEGLRAGGFGASIDGETTTFTVGILYESASAAEDTGIADLVNGLAPRVEEQSEPIDSIEAELRDNIIVVDLTGDTKRIFEEGTGGTGTQFNVAGPNPVAAVDPR